MSVRTIEMLKKDIPHYILSNEGYVFFNVPTTIYPLNVVLKTCFAFLDKAYIFLDGDPKTLLNIRIKLKKDSQEKDFSEFIGEFHNEMLNHILRERLSEEQKGIRQYIVSQALYGASTGTPPKEVLMDQFKEQMDRPSEEGKH